MASLSAYYPQPVVAGTTAGTYAEGDRVAQLGAGSVVTSTGSTTARSLANRFADVINVKDFGAVGDGATSDSAAIQAAFNACPIGGAIYFPPTENGYVITTTVDLWQASGTANRKRDITLFGQNSLIKRAPANPSTDVLTPMFIVQNTEGISFEDLHFDGGHGDWVPFAQGSNFAQNYMAYAGMINVTTNTGFLANEISDNIAFRHCKFTNARAMGILYGGNTNDIIGEEFTVDSCYFENLDGALICNPVAPRKLTISNCRLINGQTRQFLDESMWGGTRTQNHTSFFGVNINGVGIQIMGDRNSDTPKNVLDDKRATSQRWVISNNVIDNWGHMGIEMWGGKNIVISGNSISRCAYGISLAHTVGDAISCTGNSFRGNLNYDLEWGSRSSVVVGNTFDGRAILDDEDGRSLCDYGIIFWSPQNVFAQEPNLVNEDALGNIISGNLFIAHRRDSILLRGAKNTTITSNVFQSRRANSQISIVEACKQVAIVGNNFVQRTVETGYAQNQTNAAIYMHGGVPTVFVSSITRSGSVATVTCAASHNYYAGQSVTIMGADQSEYNVTATVSETGLTSTQFQYSVSGSPASPATGTNIQIVKNELPHIDVATITRSSTTATATCQTAHNLVEGQRAIVFGADQTEYNGLIVVDKIVNGTVFEYSVSGDPATPATGTIKMGRADSCNTYGVTIAENIIDGEYAQHLFLVTNDPSNRTTGPQSINNIKFINNHSVPDTASGGSHIISNFGTGSFRNWDIRNNTGGLRGINSAGLRYNQKNVPTIPNTEPTWPPRWIGDIYFNSNSKIIYIGKGTSSSSDWEAISTWNP